MKTAKEMREISIMGLKKKIEEAEIKITNFIEGAIEESAIEGNTKICKYFNASEFSLSNEKSSYFIEIFDRLKKYFEYLGYSFNYETHYLGFRVVNVTIEW